VKQRISAISLFSGAGGLDFGFHQEGFDIRVAVEVDPAACDTLNANWPSLKGRILQQPLEEISTRRLLRAAQLRVGEVGIVIGGPPCQSFCIAGNRLGLNDPRGRALLEYCRVVREAKPIAFCLENVPGLLSHQDFDAQQLIENAVNSSPRFSYQTSVAVLNAAEHGVPQLRKRVFIVGWRTAAEFYFPACTHFIASTPRKSVRKPARTTRDAFAGLPRPDQPSDIAYRVAKTIPDRNRKWYGKS
jgi:DNA (cytosine-5)-methyltransferase 1